MYVDDNGIVRFENLDKLAPLQTNLNTALESVSTNITDLKDRFNDTGWVECPYESGYTALGTSGPLMARELNGVVYLRSGASGSFPGAYVTVANLPAGITPPAVIHRGGTFGQGGRAAGIEITTDGAIRVAHALSSAPGWVSLDTDYLVG